MRWNPCAVVHWRADLGLAPPGALATVQQAVATLSSATGITFHTTAPPSYIPQREHRPAGAADRLLRPALRAPVGEQLAHGVRSDR